MTIDLYPNETLPIMWLIFMIVLLALSHLVFKPTLRLIQERKKRTEELAKEADSLLDSAKHSLESYEQGMKQARQVAAKEREAIISKARKQEQSIINKARKENEGVLTEMRDRLTQNRREAEFKLRQYAQELARAMADKILEKEAA